MPSIGDLLAGRYRIDARLGTGGMATVWRARDLRLERDVAVKVLLQNLAGDPALAARFDREAHSLAAISNVHVVAIFDVVEARQGSEPFLVMELCPDGSLGDRLADGASLAPEVALPLLADAASGLAALHARGMVHRDVTPRNVLLVGGSAKLGDFGLARPEDLSTTPGGGPTITGSAVGTLGYLAPEILEGHAATPASDVYGLGAVAYRTLTGALPRPAGSIAELAAARGRPIRPLAEAAPTVPRPAAAAIERALDAEPLRRPTAVGLAGAFRDAGSALADEQTNLDLGRAPARPAVAAPFVPVARLDAPAFAPSAAAPGKRRRGRGDRKPLPDASAGYHGPGLWSGEAIAVIVIAVVIVLLVLFLGGRPG